MEAIRHVQEVASIAGTEQHADLSGGLQEYKDAGWVWGSAILGELEICRLPV